MATNEASQSSNLEEDAPESAPAGDDANNAWTCLFSFVKSLSPFFFFVSAMCIFGPFKSLLRTISSFKFEDNLSLFLWVFYCTNDTVLVARWFWAFTSVCNSILTCLFVSLSLYDPCLLHLFSCFICIDALYLVKLSVVICLFGGGLARPQLVLV